VADKYGIPAGGDPYPGKIKYWKGDKRKLSAAEVLEVVKRAGWPEKLRLVAVMVALAESVGGAPFVYNTYKRGHFGLFQISRSAHPQFFAGDSEQWADPVANAKEALRIYNSQGWKAWQAYTDGKHKKHANEAARALLDDGSVWRGGGLLGDLLSDPAGTVGGITGAVEETVEGVADSLVPDLLSDVWESVTNPAFWMRVAYGLTGIVLIAGGLFLIVRNSPAGAAASGAVKSVAKVTPVGRAATVAKGGSK
jgi:hypothetical protein